MRVVGITGRSGCGKSSATNFLREQGYPCIDADLVAREVLLPGSACIPQLQAAFGTDIADENGEVRRRLLADRAFATPEGTAALTAITQPFMMILPFHGAAYVFAAKNAPVYHCGKTGALNFD